MLERKRIVKGRLKEVPKLKYKHELEFLASLLTDKSRVLEFGSGGFTVWFAKRAMEVVTCEDLIEWKDALAKQLNELGLTNVLIFLNDHYYKSFIWERKGFDLMYVDCYDRKETPIYLCIENYYDHVKPGGFLVFGDKNTLVSLKCKALMEKLGWKKLDIQRPYQKCYWQRPLEG